MEKLVPKLRFPEFEGDWEINSLNDYINLISGFAFKGEDISEDTSGTKLLRGINITEGEIRNSKEIDRYYIGNISKLKKFILKENDLVLGMDGSKVGKNVALLTKNEEGFLLVQRVACIRANLKSDIKYIYHNIYNPKFNKYVDVVNTSSGIPHISSKQILDYKIGFTSLPEQQKIATFLTSVDERLTLLAQQKEKLELYKKGVMQQIFSQKLRFKDEKGNNYPDWEEKKFDDLFTSISTKPFQIKSTEILNEGIYPVIDQGMNKIAGFSNEKEKLFNKENEVIIYGDHTTFVKFIDFNFVIGADGTKILESKSDNIKYLYFALSHFNIKPEGYKRHFSIIKSIELPIPSLEEQQKIASFLSAIDVQIEGVSKKIEQTKLFKKGLLQQLFV